MKSFEPPYLGAAYYPEAWPMEQVDEDISLMKQAGINAVRIGEFAWSRIEPREGQFELDWLCTVVDKLAAAGIVTIMCTPTCTPPAWLTQQYPEVVVVDARSGQSRQHGGRRHACPNSPLYRDHCTRIVTCLAKMFGKNPNVIGWQIDNELYPHRKGCGCPVCYHKFQNAMEEQFGTIEALNEAWGTRIWSQTYQSFAQLPVPQSNIWNHPSLLTAWMNFQSDSYVAFAEHQADILHTLAHQPVGTNMIPKEGVNFHKIHRKLDFVQYDHYDKMDNLWREVFWMDYCRPIKDRPFWNMETSTCWNGSGIANGYREPGFCRANSWLPIALGGEANLYWLWRAHWSGQELMHGSVVSSCGRPLHIFDEVKEVSAGYRTAADFINGTRPATPGLAVHFSSLAWWLYEFQPMVEDFCYLDEMLNFYRPLIQVQLRADVIDPAASLQPYQMICSPFLPTLEEHGLSERLKTWIESGGVWIVGPLSDIRTIHATKYRHAPFGSLEEWAGVCCKYQIPGKPRDFALRWNNGTDSSGSLWYDGLELRGAEPLATYMEGPLKGLAAVTRCKMGEGQVVMLGTMLGQEDLQNLLFSLGREVGVLPAAEASPNLLVVPRTGAAGQGMVIVELENQSASLVLNQPATDLLSGKQLAEKVEIAPYSVMVLKF